MVESTGAPESSLRRRAVSSFIWSYGGLFAGKISFFLATLVLARVLSPEDFGLVAFALAALAYINNLTVHGLGEAIVYRRDASSDRVASTVYWLSIGLSIAFTALVWMAAPLLARVADDETIWILRVLSLQLVIASFASTQGYLLRHSLEFRRLFVPDQVGGIVKGGVSVLLALAGAGVWSLVGGQLAGSFVSSTLLIARSRWRPTLTIARDEVVPTLRIGMAFTAVAILGEAARNLDFLIIGIRRGADDLGYYVLAFRLPELAVLALFEVMWNVLFPFYSRVRDEQVGAAGGEAFAGTYLRTVRLGALLAFPLGFAVAALAEPLVLTLYGDDWQPSVWPLVFIGIWAALTAVAGLPGTVFKAIGRPGLLTRCISFYLAILVPSLWFAAGSGITEVAVAHVFAQAVYLIFLAVVLGRVTKLAWWSTLAAVVPGLLVGATTAAALLPLALLLPPAVALMAALVVGPLALLAALWLVAPRDLVFVARLLRGLRVGERSAAA